MTPFIHYIEDADARGELAEIYRGYLAANPHKTCMPGILKCFSLRPDFLRSVMEFSYSLHFSEGHLTRRVKEMIATLVSALNQCPY
jgi:alkylhydroperoxidase family enzyme